MPAGDFTIVFEALQRAGVRPIARERTDG